jgi:ribonuclease BN (tRNA processing enzyme)
VIRLTVLGACGTYPAAGRACSGYLIEAAGEDRTARVWVDAGSGTLANLLRVANLPDLDAIWVSHLHVDHVSDLPVANYALRFGEWDPQPAPLPVYGPSGWAEHVRRFLATGDYGAIEDAFEVHDLSDGERIDLGPLRLEAVATEHSIETYGVRASDGAGTVGYSADSGPCDGLGRIAEAADLFVCEAAWLERPPGADPIHMTPQLAGGFAAQAGARRLVLTHLRPGADPDESLARARQAYDGLVDVAIELAAYDVTDRGDVSISPSDQRAAP